MTLFAKLRTLLDRYEAQGLETQQLTAILPLRAEVSSAREPLLDRLRELDSAQPSPFITATNVHQARFIVLERAKLAANEAAADYPFGPLVFSIVYDGDLEDALYELFERCGEPLDEIFAHCSDYPGASDRAGCIRQLMAAATPSRFSYRDTDASRAEILRALELRRRFVDFVIQQQRASDHELSRAFERLRAGRWPEGPAKPKAGARARARASARPTASTPANDTLGARLDYGLPLLRPFERALPGEQHWVRQLTELARARARRDLRAHKAREPESLLLRATFVVRTDLPAELQHGVFVPGGRYAAWLRVSKVGEAGSGDELAIKLERVAAFGHLLDLGLPEVTPTACQDFVLSSHPTFFSKDLRDYTVLQSILDARDERARKRRMSVFALRRPRESWLLARRWLRVRTQRPLEGEYHSSTAFALGPQLAVKYCLAPQPPAAGSSPEKWPANATLQERLDPSHGEALRLAFFAVVPARDVLPVEDPRVDWEAAGAQRVQVASVEIEPQDLRSVERIRVAKELVFTPWHTLDAHRPLGAFNRARLELDRAAAETSAAIGGERAPHERTLGDQPLLERRTRPPSVRASPERWSSAPHVRSRSSAPPADRLRTPKSVRAPARRKRNRSVH